MGRVGILRFLAGWALALLALPLTVAAQTEDDRTLSPYFFVHGDGATAQMPLESTDVIVSIAGVIADVTVTQRYRNDGKNAIEAEYIFPGSTRAAVYALSMTIGERKVVAEIREKSQARVEYQAAKSAGKSAALLEQQRPNVFSMKVANILPGDVIVVELRYTEIVIPTNSVYEFVFPTVVGPRYVSGAEHDAPPATQEKWQANPYLHTGEGPTSDFHLRAAINSGISIKEAASP
ncbi:MAG: VIT domain-containing protein, partial [Pseudomonadota bacterium]